MFDAEYGLNSTGIVKFIKNGVRGVVYASEMSSRGVEGIISYFVKDKQNYHLTTVLIRGYRFI